jgi:hypothetical protein
VLQDQFGRHCHTDGEPVNGRARVRLAAPTPLDIARNLAGWSAMIEHSVASAAVPCRPFGVVLASGRRG